MNKRLPEASLRSFGCLRFQSQLPTKVGTREKGREAHSLAGRGPEARGRPREGKLDRRRNPSPLTLDRVTSSMLKLCAAFPRILSSSPPPRRPQQQPKLFRNHVEKVAQINSDAATATAAEQPKRRERGEAAVRGTRHPCCYAANDYLRLYSRPCPQDKRHYGMAPWPGNPFTCRSFSRHGVTPTSSGPTSSSRKNLWRAMTSFHSPSAAQTNGRLAKFCCSP